jgi:uncharacterized protein YkwD
MRRTIGRAILIIAVLGLATGLLIPQAVADGSAPTPRGQMRRETNASRRHHNVDRVRINREMSQLARRHSLAMARRGDLFHTSSPTSVYLRGVRWHVWGENVGVTSGSPDGLQRAFMASAAHRQNVLNRSFRRVAIGAVRVDGLLWVTVFFYG